MSKVYYHEKSDSIAEVEDDRFIWFSEEEGFKPWYKIEPKKYGWVLIGEL